MLFMLAHSPIVKKPEWQVSGVEFGELANRYVPKPDGPTNVPQLAYYAHHENLAVLYKEAGHEQR